MKETEQINCCPPKIDIEPLKAENARKDAENAEMKAQIKMLMERMGMA